MGGDHLFGRYFAEPKADSGQFSFNLDYTLSYNSCKAKTLA